MTKKYKCGLYIGRFQPIHNGHESIIRLMLDECDEVIIAVGSAQEGGTMRNPFTLDERVDLINNIFYREIIAGKLHVMALRDREKPSNDSSWGQYVFQNVYTCYSKYPDVIYEGQESERNHWYDTLNIEVIRVPRGLIPISATLVRKLFESTVPGYELFDMLPKAIHYRIPEMRRVIQNAKQN